MGEHAFRIGKQGAAKGERAELDAGMRSFSVGKGRVAVFKRRFPAVRAALRLGESASEGRQAVRKRLRTSSNSGQEVFTAKRTRQK